MISLTPPAVLSAEVFDVLIGGIAEVDRAARYPAYRPEVVAAEAALIVAATSGDCCRFPSNRLSDELRGDMGWLYEQRLVRSVEGRHIYDAVMKTSSGECPYCGIADASTLDHTLPKAHYPRLAVTPINLVPVCRDCNSVKSSAVGAGNVSPYFDRWVDDETWLVSKVIDPSYPWVVAFGVVHVPTWSAEQFESVRDHFEDLKLAKRYAVQAVSEWRNYSSGFSDRARAGDGSLLSTLVERRDQTSAARRNGWRTATYQAWIGVLSTADWDARV